MGGNEDANNKQQIGGSDNKQKNNETPVSNNETDDSVPPGTKTTNFEGNYEKPAVDLFPSLYSDLS